MIFGDNPQARNNSLMLNAWAVMQAGNLFVYCMNNPVKWIDPTGLIIELAGTLEQQKILISHLQRLTDHRLSAGTDGRVGISHFATDNIRFAHGNALIERLIAAERVVRIEMWSGGNFFNPNNSRNASQSIIGSGGIVLFDPYFDPLITTFNTGGVAVSTRRPAHIGLAHELIHADRAMRGVMIPMDQTGTISLQVERADISLMRIFGSTTRTINHRNIMNEEMATIGIRHYTTSCITENMIRREHGLPIRASYGRLR